MKKIAKTAFIYAIAAMIFGVIYREGSKFLELTTRTNWSIVHTHLFVLGMLFFLIVLLIEKNFNITKDKKFNMFYIIYNTGLILTTIMLWVRGIAQITNNVPTMYDKMISGVSGIGHILLGVGIILFFAILMKRINKEKSKTNEK